MSHRFHERLKKKGTRAQTLLVISMFLFDFFAMVFKLY